MAEVVALLEQERARTPKERFYARRPSYPLRVLSKPYPKRYELCAFAQYDGRKGNVVEHVSKFIDTLGLYAADENLCLREFSKSLCDRAYTWYIGLKLGRSEEHTSELQSRTKISYAVFCLFVCRVASVTISSPWKYFVQNTSTMSSHVGIDPGFRPMYQV